MTPQEKAHSTDGQAFWTLAVGAPALLSILRLWVEAGGELQTTLLLVANVDPINLIAALVATGTWLVSAGLVVVFAIGGVLLATAGLVPSDQLPAFARWTDRAKIWLKLGSFLLAALTWQIIYLPLLVLACAAAFQVRFAWRSGPALVATLTLGLYAILWWPTVRAAWTERELFALVLLVVPPVLALAVAGPLLQWAFRPVAFLAQVAAAAALGWAVLPFVTTPILPENVIVLSGEGGTATEYLRGHVVSVDDVYTVVLRDRGGVQYVPNRRIEAQFLCPGNEELPRYRLWVYGLHVEDSVLRAVGRKARPATDTSAACQVSAS